MKTFGFNLHDFYKQNDEIAYEIYLAKKKQEEQEQEQIPEKIEHKRKKILGVF
jgi:hypothetical protein